MHPDLLKARQERIAVKWKWREDDSFFCRIWAPNPELGRLGRVWAKKNTIAARRGAAARRHAADASKWRARYASSRAFNRPMSLLHMRHLYAPWLHRGTWGCKCVVCRPDLRP